MKIKEPEYLAPEMFTLNGYEKPIKENKAPLGK